MKGFLLLIENGQIVYDKVMSYNRLFPDTPNEVIEYNDGIEDRRVLRVILHSIIEVNVEDIPQDLVPFKYCYIEGAFTVNPDYVEEIFEEPLEE